MSFARSLLATALSILSCAALAIAAPPAGAARPSGHGSVRASIDGRRRAHHARTSCAKGSAHSFVRARRAGRGCRSGADSPRKRSPNRPRPAATPRVTRPRPAATPTPAVERPSPESDAATIAAVLATPCQNTELTPEADNLPLARAAVLCLINRKRAENGESPLEASLELEQAAEGHCQELISEDYFAHVSPSGETPVDRIRTTGYIPSPSVGYVIGENLAWGTYDLSTPQAIVSAWFASPGHLANILEAQYRETGIGIMPAVPEYLAAGSPGATYAQEFGVIIP